jgi:UDP-N-acetylmuramyl pentapeptide synthase
VSGAWPEPLSLTVAHKGERARIRTNLFGEQWALGVLAALAAGLALDVPLRDGAAAIGKVHPIEGRMSPLTTPDRITFIQDTWKSPLHSIPLVLQFLQNARARRKVLLIGSISDFPGRADRKYRDVARQARTVTDKVLFVGRWAHYGLKGRSNPDDDRILAFKNLYLANTFLRDYLLPGDLVMLKGSNRNDHLERVVLDRTRKIACWRVDCRRRMHCSDCRLRNSSFIPV